MDVYLPPQYMPPRAGKAWAAEHPCQLIQIQQCCTLIDQLCTLMAAYRAIYWELEVGLCCSGGSLCDNTGQGPGRQEEDCRG